MITIELATPKHINPENIDAIHFNNLLIKDGIETSVNKKLKEIHWVINLVYKNRQPVCTYENVFVDDEKCSATYAIVYQLNNRESYHLDIEEMGNEFKYNIKIKNKSIVAYTVVKDNHIRKYPDDLGETIDYAVDTYQLLKGILR